MLDLLITNATLPDGRSNMSVAVQGGKITEVTADLKAQAKETIDAKGNLLTPPFCDPHFHMDATLSYGLPRVNESGTLLEGIALWGELKPSLKSEDMIRRALAYCDWAVAKGLLSIRSHVDTSDPSMLPVEALLEVKKQVAGYIDLQLVAFPQDGVLRTQGGIDNLKRALDMGVDVVGGIPHFERTMQQGAESVKLLCEIAAERGKLVDMHCDESDDPMSRHIETLAYETQRLGLQGRVNGSHCTSMTPTISAARPVPMIPTVNSRPPIWAVGVSRTIPSFRTNTLFPPARHSRRARISSSTRAAAEPCRSVPGRHRQWHRHLSPVGYR